MPTKLSTHNNVTTLKRAYANSLRRTRHLREMLIRKGVIEFEVKHEPMPEHSLPWMFIIKQADAFFGTGYRTRSRFDHIRIPRQIVFYFLRKYTVISLQEIGETLGYDHTTVISAIRKVDDYIATGDKWAGVIKEFEQVLLTQSANQ